MTGRFGRDVWIARSRSIPLSPGMRTSVINTSGADRRSASSTPRTSPKVVVSMPLWLRARSSTQRMEASSSTSQTLRDLVVIGGNRQQDREYGASRFAVELDEPAVPRDEVLRDRK